MKFSILIPVYNVEKYIVQCLDSVVNQTYNDYEVIVVDDGSTDSSGEICDNYHNRYPGLFKVIHKENQGLISARRVAIKHATGDYCIFVDSDDYVAENLLSEINGFLNNNDIDIVIYPYTRFNYDGMQEKCLYLANNGYIWNEENKKDLLELLATTSMIDALWIKAIKTDILKNDPIDYSAYYDKNMSEDTLQSIYPLTVAKSVGYLDISLYYYRYNPESISRCFSPKSVEKKNTVHVYNTIMEYLPKWGLDNQTIISKINARWFSEVMYFFFKSYESTKSRRERISVLSYNWKQMIPCLNIESFEEYVPYDYTKVFYWLDKKKYLKINDYFARKRIYKKYKSFRQIGILYCLTIAKTQIIHL